MASRQPSGLQTRILRSPKPSNPKFEGSSRFRGPFSKAREFIVDDALDQRHLVIAQILELALTALLGQSAVVLSDEHHQVFGNAIGHFDRVHDATDSFVVTVQVIDLARQILFDGAPAHAYRNSACSVQSKYRCQRGFDDARLDTLFLALPISWKGTLQQYADRLHRLHDSKRFVQVYDYMDGHVPMLSRMYERSLSNALRRAWILGIGW